jgi:hypothetical protein
VCQRRTTVRCAARTPARRTPPAESCRGRTRGRRRPRRPSRMCSQRDIPRRKGGLCALPAHFSPHRVPPAPIGIWICTTDARCAPTAQTDAGCAPTAHLTPGVAPQRQRRALEHPTSGAPSRAARDRGYPTACLESPNGSSKPTLGTCRHTTARP